ncbi:MAG: hypothetical protein ACP5PW_02845, partial [Candidatus Dormibacteria bacterium]
MAKVEDEVGRTALDEEVEPTAAAEIAAPPEILAESLGEYVRAWGRRVAGGESGALPVVLALVIIAVAFEIWTQGLFLSPQNLVNLFIESMVFMTLGMAE